MTHKISLSSYFSSGNYGADQETEIQYFPMSYEVAKFPWILSLTVPYLKLKGPGDVFLETGNIGRNRTPSNEIIGEDGIGDVVVSASYQFDPLFQGWLYMDLTLQGKIPTADESRDLGTGERDLAYQLDFYTSTGRNTWFSSLGYRQRGKTPLYDLRDSAYASLGYMRQTGESSYLGLIYDYREKASSNAFESRELMPFYSIDFDSDWNFMVYTIFGFTDSSADKTLGVQVSYTFP